jgi:WhiB family transcriptional regulator, redox-sensing transcriptional regulator
MQMAVNAYHETGYRGTAYRETGARITSGMTPVPGDWFVDPVSLGVPGVRKPVEVEDDNPLAWQADSLCAQTDPEAFFPEKGGSTRDAKKICTSCEVRAQCLEYALENDERFGIWGGLSERERRKLRKRA